MAFDGYGIMRIEKRHKSDVSGLEKEANREAEHPMNFPASDIDWERTAENIHLVKSDDWHESINQILADHDLKARSNSVVMLDGLYTATPEALERMARDCQGTDRDYVMEYFQGCLDFHEQNYGQVFNAVIHLDETTPHMQVASVPILQDEQGKWHLSARELCGNKGDYIQRQDKFYEEVGQHFGLLRGESRTPEHNREHLSVQEFKLQENEKALHEQEKTMKVLDNEIALQKEDLKELDEQYELKEEEIEAYKEAEKDKFNEMLHERCEEVDRRLAEYKQEKQKQIDEKVDKIVEEKLSDPMFQIELAQQAEFRRLERELNEEKKKVKVLEAFKEKAEKVIEWIENKFKLPEQLQEKLDNLLDREQEIDRDDDLVR